MYAMPQIHHAPPPYPHLPWPAPPQPPGSVALGTDADASFVALLNAYRRCGGLARAAEVRQMLAGQDGGGAACLARWLSHRCVIGIEWHGQTWLPRFQFLQSGPLPDRTVAAAMLELNTVFDAWEVAQWFVWPNSALDGRVPAELLEADPVCVLRAARLDRYIANG